MQIAAKTYTKVCSNCFIHIFLLPQLLNWIGVWDEPFVWRETNCCRANSRFKYSSHDDFWLMWCYAFVIVIEAVLQTDIDSADDEIASSRGNYLKISINDDACLEDSIINSMKSVNEQGKEHSKFQIAARTSTKNYLKWNQQFGFFVGTLLTHPNSIFITVISNVYWNILNRGLVLKKCVQYCDVVPIIKNACLVAFERIASNGKNRNAHSLAYNSIIVFITFYIRMPSC